MPQGAVERRDRCGGAREGREAAVLERAALNHPVQRLVAVVVARDAEPLDRGLVALHHADELGDSQLGHDERGTLLGSEGGVAEGVLVVRRDAAVERGVGRRPVITNDLSGKEIGGFPCTCPGSALSSVSLG